MTIDHNCLELNLHPLHANSGEPGDDMPEYDPLEELQLRAEMTMVRQTMENKMRRHRKADWY